MAAQKRTKNRTAAKRPKLRYFFINGQLHKKLTINRGRDLLVAWNYPEGKKVTYTYSDVLRRHQKAFTSTEVADMMMRSKKVIDDVITSGMVRTPQFTYGLDENRNKYKYMWREEDIMELHDYLSTIHRGRPRKDGEINPQQMPTKRELRAIIHDENVLYVKQGDTFIPTWRAKDI